jgi:hypothetical protein
MERSGRGQIYGTVIAFGCSNWTKFSIADISGEIWNPCLSEYEAGTLITRPRRWYASSFSSGQDITHLSWSLCKFRYRFYKIPPLVR